MYQYIRPLVFRGDAEEAHEKIMRLARYGSLPLLQKLLKAQFGGGDSKKLQKEAMGLLFPNPIGMAAGFDKNGRLVDVLDAFGFGFVEIGTVTPRPQAGNPRPRLFRRDKERALVNRMGFNNDGVKVIAERLRKRKSHIIVGANIGKNMDTPNEKAAEDYASCFMALHELVDYIAVNVSSPNTPRLRELQEKESLHIILSRLQELNADKKPMLLKIAPELTNEQLDDILEVAQGTSIAGIIATNTIKTEDGGLSGQPLRSRSTEVIRYISQRSRGDMLIVGVGGIFSAEDAYEKIQAGAQLVQLYTGLVYEGPSLVKHVKQRLVAHLEKRNEKEHTDN